MDQSFCPNDGSLMSRGVRSLTLESNGIFETLPDIEGWCCNKCDHITPDPSNAQIISRAWNGLRAKSLGYLEPAEVRRIRKKLDLSQVEAGLIIGGGPRAFQKYENGDQFLSRGIDSALRMLDCNPSYLSILRARFSEQAAKMYNASLHAAHAIDDIHRT